MSVVSIASRVIAVAVATFTRTTLLFSAVQPEATSRMSPTASVAPTTVQTASDAFEIAENASGTA
ncbi:hypothetical protein D3C72_2476510 [compost metagenome]